MGEECVEDDIGFTFEFAPIHVFRDHLGGVRMQIISGVFTEDQRVAPRAEIRLQILDRLAGLFVNQMIMQLSRLAGDRFYGIELQFEARALDGLD